MKTALLAALFTALGASGLLAHDEGSSTSEVRIEGRDVIWAVDAGTLGLQRIMDFGAPPHKLTEESIVPFKRRIADYVRSGLSVRINGRDVEPETGETTAVFELIPPTDVRVLSKIRQEFRFRSPVEIERVTLSYHLFTEFVANHRAVFSIAWGERSRQVILYGRGEVKIRPDTMDPDASASVRPFFAWGVRQLFAGVVPLAFLLALLLAARGPADLAKVGGAFASAQCLALLLAALDLVRIPARATEILMAVSIVAVALANAVFKDGRHRTLLGSAFGLVQGLGFSAPLHDLLTEQVVVPSLAFMAGVVACQAALLAAGMLALRLLQRGSEDPVRRRVVLAGSVPLLLLGCGWLAEAYFKSR